jgi:hypothetical protein
MTTTRDDLTTIVDGYLAAYCEPDPGTRAELVRAAWAEDGELVDPPLTGAGHDGIAALGDAVQEHYPGHRFRRTCAVDAHHDRLRFTWELVGPDGNVAVTGSDFAELAPDGRLRRVTGFFGELEPIGS